MSKVLIEKMEVYKQAVSAEMRQMFKLNGAQPDPFYGMMQYHMGWLDADFELQESKAGKMIRPITLLLCCEAAGGDWRQAIPAAASLEILHNFSLVHDDIEDGSETRRGRETVWQIWGEPQAINVGDAMFSTAQLAMVRLADTGVSAEIVVTAMRRLNEMCLALTHGQYRDMSFEQRDDVTVDDYLQMIEGKTAVLLSLAAELGALIGGASSRQVDCYAQFGLNLGLAFQVQDDILGIWGDEAEIGKSAESDILTKKKSLPVLHGLAESEALRLHYTKSAESADFVQNAIALLDSVEAKAHASATADRYSEIALGGLDSAEPQGDAAVALQQLAQLLLQRKS